MPTDDARDAMQVDVMGEQGGVVAPVDGGNKAVEEVAQSDSVLATLAADPNSGFEVGGWVDRMQVESLQELVEPDIDRASRSSEKLDPGRPQLTTRRTQADLTGGPFVLYPAPTMRIPLGKELLVSLGDKIMNAAEGAAGKIKEATGLLL